jgi:hypothetical protein
MRLSFSERSTFVGTSRESNDCDRAGPGLPAVTVLR